MIAELLASQEVTYLTSLLEVPSSTHARGSKMQTACVGASLSWHNASLCFLVLVNFSYLSV